VDGDDGSEGESEIEAKREGEGVGEAVGELVTPLLLGKSSGSGLSAPLALFHNAQALHSVPRHWGVSSSPQLVHCLVSSEVRGANRG
jgi:hypothetical protein